MSADTGRNPRRVHTGPAGGLFGEPGFFNRRPASGAPDIDMGYRHRGIEKLSESRHFSQVVFLTERICGLCSVSHPLAFVSAVEDLAGIEIPERAKYIRTLAAEMERIQAHLLWLGLAGRLTGYDTLWMWCARYRAPLLEVCGKIFGNRRNYAVMKIGGVRRDISVEQGKMIKAALNKLLPKTDMIEKAVEDDPVLGSLLKGKGVLPREDARKNCVTGPAARASDIDIDLRRDEPYAAYPMVEFSVPVLGRGDLYARAVIRLREIRQSALIIMQCEAALRKTDTPLETKTDEIPPGEGIGRNESPRGEVFHYLNSRGGNLPYRHRIWDPGFTDIAFGDAGGGS